MFALPTSGTRRQVLLRIAIAALAAVIVVGGGIGLYRHFHTSTTLHALGRDYTRSPGVETLQQIHAQGFTSPVILNDLPSTHTPPAAINLQPTVIFVRHGSVYWSYALEGGP